MTPFAGKSAGRAAAVLATFAVSSWIHEFGEWKRAPCLAPPPPLTMLRIVALAGLASAVSDLPPPDEPLTFYLRWGGSIYFMMQGVAIILEGLFRAVTGRKVGGWLGTLWMSVFVVGCGVALRDSWCASFPRRYLRGRRSATELTRVLSASRAIPSSPALPCRITQGLLREVPPVPYWSWQRFVVPMGCLQPPPLWMTSHPDWYYAERAHATF